MYHSAAVFLYVFVMLFLISILIASGLFIFFSLFKNKNSRGFFWWMGVVIIFYFFFFCGGLGECEDKKEGREYDSLGCLAVIGLLSNVM